MFRPSARKLPHGSDGEYLYDSRCLFGQVVLKDPTMEERLQEWRTRLEDVQRRIALKKLRAGQPGNEGDDDERDDSDDERSGSDEESSGSRIASGSRKGALCTECKPSRSCR